MGVLIVLAVIGAGALAYLGAVALVGKALRWANEHDINDIWSDQ